MRKLILLLLVGFVGIGSAQVRYGDQVASGGLSLTITVIGSGTGNIHSTDGFIVNCTQTGGTCSHTYTGGAGIALIPTLTGGSGFAWTSGTGSATGCSGLGYCIFNITAATTITGVFTGEGSGAIPASPTFAIDYNSATLFPTTINHGQGRIWDTPGAQWPFIETASAVYGWSSLDNILFLMTQSSVRTAQYGLARTPNWASSNTTLYVTGTLTSGTFSGGETIIQTGSGVSTTFVSSATNTLTIAQYSGTANNTGTWVGQTSGAIFTPTLSGTNYYPQDICSSFTNGSTAPGSLPGQCAPPTDLNSDGTGTDLIWRTWVAAIASRVNSTGYQAGTGTWAAGGANCPGAANCTHAHIAYWEIWNEPDSTNFWTGSIDQQVRMEQDAYCIIEGGSFTIVKTGETCGQVQATVGLGGPIDTTAQVIMPSYHASTTVQAQCFLYSTGAGCAGTSGSAGAAQTDAINFHLKPGASLETTIPSEIAAIDGVLQSAELAKPLDNTEFGYNAAGWTCPLPGPPPGGNPATCYTDPNMQASYIARGYVYFYNAGLVNDAWYNWSPGQNGMGSVTANNAYTQIYNWMVGGTAWSGCGVTGTVHTCAFTLANGVAASIIWDTAQYCTGTPSVCTFSTQTVNSAYLSYLDLYGNPKVSIVSHQMQVGIMPRLAQAQ